MVQLKSFAMFFYIFYLKVHIEYTKRKFSCIAIKFITLVRFYDYYSLWKTQTGILVLNKKTFLLAKSGCTISPLFIFTIAIAYG